MSGTECEDSGTFSAMISWNTVIDSSTVIPTHVATVAPLYDTTVLPISTAHTWSQQRYRWFCVHSNQWTAFCYVLKRTLTLWGVSSLCWDVQIFRPTLYWVTITCIVSFHSHAAHTELVGFFGVTSYRFCMLNLFLVFTFSRGCVGGGCTPPFSFLLHMLHYSSITVLLFLFHCVQQQMLK